MKIESNSNKFITKMISEKISTNPESFTGFGRGRRIDWRNPIDTPNRRICVFLDGFDYSFQQHTLLNQFLILSVAWIDQTVKI